MPAVIGGPVGEKAQRFVAEGRVLAVDGYGALVHGDTGWYQVHATPAGLTCTCPARGVCAHILAAMVVWAEP